MTAEAIQRSYLPVAYVYAARYGEGRVSLPVLRSQALYASFQHVSGVPAQDGMAAYSVDKLHMLEVLIGRLESVKSEPLAARESPPDLDPGRVDALIQQYSAEIHSIATAPALPYAPRASEPGMLFALAA